jgi:ABC-2 type transport system permease protein
MALLWSSVPIAGLVLSAIGAPPDWAALAWTYLGALLVSSFFCAIGLALSAATNTPLLAAFFSFVVNLVVLTLPLAATYLGSAPGDKLRRWLSNFDVVLHYQGSFLRGLFDSSHVVFFVAWTGFFLFLATRFLETRRWR